MRPPDGITALPPLEQAEPAWYRLGNGRRCLPCALVLLGLMSLPGCHGAESPTDRSDGARLYATYCSSCHGNDARNDRHGANPEMRLTHAATLTGMEWRQVVLHGRKTMPAFGNRLGPHDVDAISRYVKTLSKIADR